jgi:hypothetical protein
VAKVLENKVQVVAAGLKTQKSYSTIHYLDKFERKVQIVYGAEGARFSANAKRFRSTLEATKIRMSHEFDPLFAAGVSKIDFLPHQIEAVYDYLLKRPDATCNIR